MFFLRLPKQNYSMPNVGHKLLCYIFCLLAAGGALAVAEPQAAPAVLDSDAEMADIIAVGRPSDSKGSFEHMFGQNLASTPIVHDQNLFQYHSCHHFQVSAAFASKIIFFV